MDDCDTPDTRIANGPESRPKHPALLPRWTSRFGAFVLLASVHRLDGHLHAVFQNPHMADGPGRIEGGGWREHEHWRVEHLRKLLFRFQLGWTGPMSASSDGRSVPYV